MVVCTKTSSVSAFVFLLHLVLIVILKLNLFSHYNLSSSLWRNLSTPVETFGHYEMFWSTHTLAHTDTLWAGRAIEILMEALSLP